MKKILLFSLFLMIPSLLWTMDEVEGKYAAEKWQLTHIVHLCDGITKREEENKIVFMYPQMPQLEQDKEREKELDEVIKEFANPKVAFDTICAKTEKIIERELRKEGGGCKKIEKIARGLFNCILRTENQRDLENAQAKAQKRHLWLKKYNRDNFLQNLGRDGALNPGIACQINGDVYRVSVFTGEALGPVHEEFPPKNLDFVCGGPGGQQVDSTPRFEQEEVSIENNELIIKDDKILLSELLPPKRRKIVDSITFGYEAGDRIAILFDSGELALLKKMENNEGLLVVESDYYKKQKRNKIISKILIFSTIPTVLLLQSNVAMPIKCLGFSCLLAATLYYVNFRKLFLDPSLFVNYCKLKTNAINIFKNIKFY